MTTFHPKSDVTLTGDLPPCYAHTERSGKRVYLLPGYMHVSTERCEITTILGSCVSLCLWDKRLRIGGMNHYLLAEEPGLSSSSCRYGSVANEALLASLRTMGCHLRDIRGKLFGGASAFAVHPEQSVGTKNVRLAEEFLHKWNIPVLSKDVNGKRGRRLIFHTDDGTTLLRTFDKS